MEVEKPHGRHLVRLLLCTALLSITAQPDLLREATARRQIHVIAHRGASARAPENTLFAFRKAIELGADVLELDVHQTKDSQLVVIHDGSVDRTTNGAGDVGDLAWHDLQHLDAGSWFDTRFSGERIPLLADVFDNTPDSILLLVELKNGSDVYPGIERRVVNLARRFKAERRVILKSFDDDILRRLSRIAPEIPRLKIVVTEIPFLGLIVEHGVNFGTILNDDVQYLQHHWFGLTGGFINEAHGRGYRVFAWDVNDRDRMLDLIAKGIDGIETDHPDILRSLLK